MLPPFPYMCPECGGAFNTCAIRRQNELIAMNMKSQSSERSLNDWIEMERTQFNSNNTHRDCSGGRFCYEKQICIVAGDYFYDGQTDNDDGGTSSEQHGYICGPGVTYDGYRRAVIDTTHTIGESDKVQFYCRTCFFQNKLKSKTFMNQNLKPICDRDNEFRENHAFYLLTTRLGLSSDVIRDCIFPFLRSCPLRPTLFDCLLCQMEDLKQFESKKRVMTNKKRRLIAADKKTVKNKKKKMRRKNKIGSTTCCNTQSIK